MRAKRRGSVAHRRFEGLVLSAGSVRDYARARGALRRAGLGRWKVRPLGPGSVDLFASPPRGARVSIAQAWDLAYRLRADRDVERAEPAFETVGHDAGRMRAPSGRRSVRGSLLEDRHLPESDPHDWALGMCRVREAWAGASTPGGRGVVVAHPDTGYTDHPQLDAGALRLDLGHNFVEENSNPEDPLQGFSPGHGTATGSVLVSAVDTEVTGVAPEAMIVPLRVNDSVVHFSWRRLCAALYWAFDRKLHVASLSLGGPWGGSGALEEAVRQATGHGVILVAAAGNHWPSVVYPACFPEVVAVAACNALHEPWSGTSAGPEVDITAPGESVWRAKTSANGKYAVERSSGTSYAAATVAGLCALWIAHKGGFDLLETQYGSAGVGGVFKEALQASVYPPQGWDGENMGPGIALADKLLAHPLPASAPARGTRIASRRRAAPGAWERIEGFFPEAAPDRIRGALLSAFMPVVRRASARMDPVLDELHFHIATDPSLRTALGTRLARGRRAARAARPVRFAFAGASSQFQRMLAAY